MATLRISNIKLGGNGKTQIVDMSIQRLDKPDSLKGLILIVFTDITEFKKLESELKNRKTDS
jgi:hypothetical protein